MRTFEESLNRILDPDHYLWGMITSEQGDPSRLRSVEIRLDVPKDAVHAADEAMKVVGWQLSSRPDEMTDTLERIFWRKTTAISPDDIASLLTGALKVAHDNNGTLVSWMNVEELGEL